MREYAVAFTFGWNSSEAAKKFFESLKKSGSEFPYKEARHEIALVRGDAGDFVAVLVQLEDGSDESVLVKKTLNAWFASSGAGAYSDDEWLTAPLPGRLKGSLSAVLGSNYKILDILRFVGQPAPVSPGERRLEELVAQLAEKLRTHPESSLPMVNLAVKETPIGKHIVWCYRTRYDEPQLDSEAALRFLVRELEPHGITVTDGGYMGGGKGREGEGNQLFQYKL
jgi:hypothetical protein